MSLDTTRVGQVAAELMEAIADEHGDADVEIGEVAVVVEVGTTDDADADEGWTTVNCRCSDHRRWVQAGLLDAAKRAVFASSERADEDGGEDE